MKTVHPYHQYQHLLFSVVDAPPDAVSSWAYNEARNSLERRANVQDAFRRNPELLNPTRFHLEPCECDLSWAYDVRPIPGFQPFQELYWEPRNCPRTSVVMSNMYDGPFVGRDLPWDSVRVLLRDKDHRFDPSYHFDYYASRGSVHRELCVARDDNEKWTVVMVGEMQPFEQPEYYRRRRIIDRVNREIITEYLITLGYDITDEAFWTTNSQSWLVWDDFGGKKPKPIRHHFEE